MCSARTQWWKKWEATESYLDKIYSDGIRKWACIEMEKYTQQFTTQTYRSADECPRQNIEMRKRYKY